MRFAGLVWLSCLGKVLANLTTDCNKPTPFSAICGEIRWLGLAELPGLPGLPGQGPCESHHRLQQTQSCFCNLL